MSIVKAILAFRLNIDSEFQGWVLMFANLTAIWLFLLPCYCAGLSWPPFRRFATFIQMRLPFFYAFMFCFNAGWLFLVVTWLPDWAPKDYLQCLGAVVKFMLGHVLHWITSILVIFAFIFLFVFRDRIALLAGIDHLNIFKCKMRDCLVCGNSPTLRSIELFVLKVEDLPAADILNGNNVFVEVFLGYNETMKTRVHNNGGTSCSIKESIQLNFDDEEDDEDMFLFVKGQKVMNSKQLGQLRLNSKQIAEMEERTKGRNARNWNEGDFVKHQLIPSGSIWLAVASVDDEDRMNSC